MYIPIPLPHFRKVQALLEQLHAVTITSPESKEKSKERKERKERKAAIEKEILDLDTAASLIQHGGGPESSSENLLPKQEGIPEEENKAQRPKPSQLSRAYEAMKDKCDRLKRCLRTRIVLPNVVSNPTPNPSPHHPYPHLHPLTSTVTLTLALTIIL
jgi:hypothetical protein